MLFKSATSIAFASACLTALATAPGAMAQPANPSGAYGSTYNNQMQQPPQSNADWSRGGYGSSSGNYTPQADQGNASAGGDQLVTNGPQSNVEQQSPDWSARQNVIQSHHYTRMLETSAAFRHARMRKECGPITDPQLHENCIASFNRSAPEMYGSSMAPHHYHSSYGR